MNITASNDWDRLLRNFVLPWEGKLAYVLVLGTEAPFKRLFMDRACGVFKEMVQTQARIIGTLLKLVDSSLQY